MNKLKDKEWLETQYIDLLKTTGEIAKELNCAKQTVCNWLKKHNIDPINSRLVFTGIEGKKLLHKHY